MEATRSHGSLNMTNEAIWLVVHLIKVVTLKRRKQEAPTWQSIGHGAVHESPWAVPWVVWKFESMTVKMSCARRDVTPLFGEWGMFTLLK